jgi:phosphatidylglycerophosphate synthase
VSQISDLRVRVQRRTLNIYDTVFTRRVSIYLTIVLARLGATPNGVSIAGAIVGGSACVFMALGSQLGVMLGVVLLHLYAVLDSVDGELARLTQRFSLVGLFIEDLSAYVMINAFNLAVGWRLYADGHLVWPLLGAIVIAAFGRNVMPVARRALIKSIVTRRPPTRPPSSGAPTPRSSVREFLHENVVHVTNQWMIVSALLALWVYQRVPTQVVAVAFGATLVLFALREVVALTLMIRGDRLERELATIYAAATEPSELDGGRLSRYQAL